MKHIVYAPADGEELPDPNIVPVDALISGTLTQAISAIVDDSFSTAGTIYYLGTLQGPIQLLPLGDVIYHQHQGWPIPTDTAPPGGLQ